MITGLKIENASIGSNLTVQLSPVFEGKTNRSDPITIGMIQSISIDTYTHLEDIGCDISTSLKFCNLLFCKLL